MFERKSRNTEKDQALTQTTKEQEEKAVEEKWLLDESKNPDDFPEIEEDL